MAPESKMIPCFVSLKLFVSRSKTFLFTGLCPPGQEWKHCAFKCNETCDAFRHKFIDLNMCSSNGDDNRCIPGCRSVVCSPPYVYKDLHTCVKPSQCPCIDSNGVYRKVKAIHFIDFYELY